MVELLILLLSILLLPLSSAAQTSKRTDTSDEVNSYSLTEFTVHIRSDHRVQQAQFWNTEAETWQPLQRTGPGWFRVSRDQHPLNAQGEARFNIQPIPEGVYLLPYNGEEHPRDNLNWLRRHSFAYAEPPFESGSIRISHRSGDAALSNERNGRAGISFHREPFLRTPFQVRVRGEPATYDSDDGVFRDPWGNPIHVEARSKKDRIQFNVRYRIEHEKDTWSDVRMVFHPSFHVDGVETLSWDQFKLPRRNVSFRLDARKEGKQAQVDVARIAPRTWHHLCITYKPGSTRVFLDGMPVEESSFYSGPIRQGKQPLIIGNTLAGHRPFHGRIDELFVADRALSGDRIRELMKHGVETKKDSSGSNLVAAWSMEADDRKSIRDRSGHNNHGKIQGNVKRMPGKIGRGLNFSGTKNAGVRVDHDDTLQVRKELTIGGWIRWEKPIRFGRLIDKGGGTFACFFKSSSAPYQFLPSSKQRKRAFTQSPYIRVRGNNGQSLGFLDHKQSNLFFRADAEKASVEYWAWPRKKGAEYRWTFEVIPGYGPYANSFLRALDPHTRSFERKLEGRLASRFAARHPERAAKHHVRSVWYHGVWFHRNGKYFNTDQPIDAEYQTAKGKTSTYRERIRDVERARKHGINLYMYTQFAGISRPATSDFSSSLVRDVNGDPVKVGHDGKYDNIWANPDPDLPYGTSFVKQVNDMLETFNCAGISMDRVDRLDHRHGSKLFDLGHFDGSATPFKHEGNHRPCSSLALQGKRFWKDVRNVLDQHDALWLANLPSSLPIARLADGFIADVPHTPWNAFFLRALTNGKRYFVYDRPHLYRKSIPLVARLIQAGSTYFPSGVSYPETPPQPTRLLYALPEHSSYPRLWIFADGSTRMSYDKNGPPTLRQRYEGSRTTQKD